MNRYICLSLLLLGSLTACKDVKKESLETVTVPQEKVVHSSAELTAEFQDVKVAEVYKAYNKVKTALVNTDNASAAIAASELLTAYANIGVEEDAFKNASAIIDNTIIENQREAFEKVTADVEKILEGALSSGVIYKQFCPMAFNNKGAYWLSNTKEIRNPYFGDMMLKCGRVAEEIE